MKRLLFIIVYLLTVSFAGQAQERHALVIGIGQYEDSRWKSIHGDSDVDYVLETLQKNGFKDIRTLRNEAATKMGIVSAFESLKQSCSPGDRVYVHFSGHGQQITDTDGDEVDGYDEAWIPYDAQPYYSESYKGENHLVDDEVNRILSGIKTRIGPSGRLLVVIDACHSGHATREQGDSTVARGFDKKFEIPCKKPKRIPPLSESWITISACQPYQINWEVTKPAVGKLTWCLYRLGSKLRSLSNGSLKASIIRIMQEYPGPLDQTPVMSGNVESESVKDIFK